MPISQKDLEFMEQVAAYYRGTISPLSPKGSIRDTAKKFGIGRNKVRKILVTMGELESPITQDVVRLRQEGMSIEEIARTLGVSVATISTALPYEDKVDNTLEPTAHASDVREYRAYEREQVKRQAGHGAKKQEVSDAWKGGVSMSEQKTVEKEWEKDIKMSYTQAYHRPQRLTWDDWADMRAFVVAKLEEEDSEELRRILAEIDFSYQRNEDEDLEYQELAAKKTLTEEEEDRLHQLMYKTGQFPGALDDRNIAALEKIAGNRLPPNPDVIRLHLELYEGDPFDEEESPNTDVFRKYGKLEYGPRISRDIIVPSDIPLYALHYVIQRVFGWQNYHLHQFELPKEREKALIDDTSTWRQLVGVLFRSPLMDENEEFWADDYNGGSFKNWLRKKYTGPYLSQCEGEGLFSCLKDMQEIDLEKEYYVVLSKSYNRETMAYDDQEYVSDVIPVYDWSGKKVPEPKASYNRDIPYRIQIMRFKELPPEILRRVFDDNPMALLERLPLDSVLVGGRFFLPEDYDLENESVKKLLPQSGAEVYRQVEDQIQEIMEEQVDSPSRQVELTPVTDVLLYRYDFGDSWRIKITTSDNCVDLVVSGRITQAELDRANVKCREVYRPVLIAKDGEAPVEDVGGMSGFADFLVDINPDLKGMDPEDKEGAKQQKKELLTWAKSQGWHKENPSDLNLL